jgi:hypothetical protein
MNVSPEVNGGDALEKQRGEMDQQISSQFSRQEYFSFSGR